MASVQQATTGVSETEARIDPAEPVNGDVRGAMIYHPFEIQHILTCLDS